jgi:VIT1/CCC1 family predicted Fe2+/Mn2+ transporter
MFIDREPSIRMDPIARDEQRRREEAARLEWIRRDFNSSGGFFGSIITTVLVMLALSWYAGESVTTGNALVVGGIWGLLTSFIIATRDLNAPILSGGVGSALVAFAIIVIGYALGHHPADSLVEAAKLIIASGVVGLLGGCGYRLGNFVQGKWRGSL